MAGTGEGLAAWWLVPLALVGLQRLLELAYARHTAGRITAAGGRWVRRDGFAAIVAVQVLWLGGCAIEAATAPWAAHPPWARGLAIFLASLVGLLLFLAGEALRYASMRALGWRWHTRVYALDAPLVATGPYRRLRHPIYLGVLLEGVGLPLLLGLWATLAMVAVLLPLVLLRRVRTEERVLGITRAE